MDLSTVTSFRRARGPGDLALAPGETVLAGGTWLFGEPQPEVTGLVDLTAMGWPDLEVSPAGLRIGATCSIARLVRFARDGEAPAEWAATRMFPVAADALLASFKIWNTATVGGNIARAFAAAAMVSLATGLDGTAEVWTPDGGERTLPVAEIPARDGVSTLRLGEVIRAIDLPARTLRSRFTLHRIALAELGRSAAVVTGRADEDGAAVFVVTAATERPVVLRFPAAPSATELAEAVRSAPGYFSDPLGAADWRRAVSVVLAERARAELAGETRA
ncbi:FAD-binding molybdopterin dehydrogenase [Microbacterium sp. Root53]|uniref:FAD binding domain-containing protein n=1 Tax=Microbacterium sp. Root53 TaxID=1736553 RepID=UPI0007006E1D|nr:FAD binding domain-containing protein [Microbacterium sp. Root53]KQZ06013.1 FAD-binding molybdopterin dehydrogenase [Microbacterium sp. Root53]